MKIIISPSKTMKPRKHTIDITTPKYIEKSNILRSIISDYSIDEITNKYSVSDKLAHTIKDSYNDKTIYPALFYYTGTVFKQLDLKAYEPKHYEYIKKHLNILDALYGILNYSDGISFYRLDYTTKLDEYDLYNYWQDSINDTYQNEDFIINLASNEFSKQIKNENMITIDFCIKQDEKIKRPSMLIKKARGQMLNYLILNTITQKEELKHINIDGFKYEPNLSNQTQYVFLKD